MTSNPVDARQSCAAVSVEEAKAAHGAAIDQVERVEKRIREAKAEASRAVDERFRAELGAVQAMRAAAHRALIDAKDGTPDHPWTGKRVFAFDVEHGRWGGPDKRTRIEGVVETRRSNTVMPAGRSYGLPSIGEAFVRLLKKGGGPGLRVDGLQRSEWNGGPWLLVESEAQQGPTK